MTKKRKPMVLPCPMPGCRRNPVLVENLESGTGLAAHYSYYVECGKAPNHGVATAIYATEYSAVSAWNRIQRA